MSEPNTTPAQAAAVEQTRWFADEVLAGYRSRMKAFGGFNYRVQLNVRNLLNENDPVPVGALTTGAISRVATVDSRTFVMTFAVDF